MKVLIACEYSGIIRAAFEAKGHDVLSCDLLPTEIPGLHYQGDVRDIINDGWDLMIAHPPCQYLSYAAPKKLWERSGRADKRMDAIAFFWLLYSAPIKRICVENPCGVINTCYRKPDQTIHPYFFGEPHLKRTCLWLKNLPKLQYTNVLPKPDAVYIDRSGRKRYFVCAIGGFTKDAAKRRAKSFPGIAAAMAEQWGSLTD